MAGRTTTAPSPKCSSPLAASRSVRGYSWGLSVAFTPDSKRLATGAEGKQAVTLWDIESEQELLAVEGDGSNFWRTEFSPDGNVLASENMKGVLHLWRAPSWGEIDATEAKEAKNPQPR